MSVIAISKPAQARRRAPRLAGDARRAQIVEAACVFFADNGFGGPTRDLAASIGVTQALLYRYFDSKTDLIDAVFAAVFREHWSDGALERFQASAGRPMVDRVADAYEHMLRRMTGVAIRLFFRAGLDSHPAPLCQSAGRSWPLWTAMLDEWRREEGVPSVGAQPMLEGERLLMLAMHNAFVMIRTREHVFHAPSALSDADQVRQTAEMQDAAVRAVLRRLHSGEASATRVASAGAALEAA